MFVVGSKAFVALGAPSLELSSILLSPPFMSSHYAKWTLLLLCILYSMGLDLRGDSSYGTLNICLVVAHVKAELDFCSKHKALDFPVLWVSVQITATLCMQKKKIINLSDYPWYLLTI